MGQGRAWFKSWVFRGGVLLLLVVGVGAYLTLRPAPNPRLTPTGEAKPDSM